MLKRYLKVMELIRCGDAWDWEVDADHDVGAESAQMSEDNKREVCSPAAGSRRPPEVVLPGSSNAAA